MFAAASAVDQPLFGCDPPDPGRVDAVAVVPDLDHDAAAGVAGGDRQRAGGRLAGRDSLLRRLEAVVERVADEVDEWVAEGVDDGPVELGLAAEEFQLDLLAEFHREVSHKAREAHEHDVDRDHPHLHDHRLQRLRAARQVLDGVVQLGPLDVRRQRLHGRPVDDELAHQVHQRVEPLGVDANSARVMACARGGLRAAAVRGGRSRDLAGRAVRARDRRRRWRWRRRWGWRRALRSGEFGDRHRRDIRHARRRPRDLVFRRVGGQPRLHVPAREGLDVLRRGRVGHQLAVIGERGEQHVSADRRHHHVVVELGDDVQDACARLLCGTHRGRFVRDRRLCSGGELLGGGRLLGVAGADETSQAFDQGHRVELLAAIGLDRFDRLRQRVEAGEDRVDGVLAEPAGPLAEQLEHLLHLMGQLRDRGEPHRGAHALEGMGDAEDLVERRTIRGVLLQLDHGEVEFLEVLARLRQEHGHVLGGVHYAFR